MTKLEKKFNLSKKVKFNYTYIYSFIRTFLGLVNKITVQRYITNTNAMVDIFIRVNPTNILTCIKLLSKSLFFTYDQLVNLTCVDNLTIKGIKKRFTLVYVFNKINTNSRLIMLVDFKETDLIPSISPFFKAANWLEREVFDLFGVFFINHFDLRRILTDYGFKGFPLRKDFPLTGYLELRYDEGKKYVKYQRLVLMQEYRFFNFTSPWKQYHINSLKR
jgi:NADH-quinone oxidoreductase subunit C